MLRDLSSLMRFMPTRGILPSAATKGGLPLDQVPAFFAKEEPHNALSKESVSLMPLSSTSFSMMLFDQAQLGMSLRWDVVHEGAAKLKICFKGSLEGAIRIRLEDQRIAVR